MFSLRTLLIVAFAGLLTTLGSSYLAYEHGKEVQEAKTTAAALQQAVKSMEQSHEWRDKFHKAQGDYLAAESARQVAERDMRATRERMRASAPSAGSLSRHSAAALSEYAAAAERDLDRCAADLERFAGESAGAAGAAGALLAGWPTVARKVAPADAPAPQD